MNTIDYNDMELVGSGADSIVFSIGGNKNVLKIYSNLSEISLRKYHLTQSTAAKLIHSHLPEGLHFNGQLGGKLIRKINIRVLALAQNMIIPLSQALFNQIDIPGYIPRVGSMTSVIPYIGGQKLTTYITNPASMRGILERVDEEFMELGIPLGGANGYDGLHPDNIKVFLEGGDAISLVVTDIGASVLGVISQNASNQ